MPFIEADDGTRLHYKDWGRGAPILFLHGFTLSSDIWDEQMTMLSASFRTLAYDRRGHGRSDRPGGGYDFDTLANDLAEVMRSLDLRRVILVAHSMAAGEVARYLANHGAGRIARVVLVSPVTPWERQRDGEMGGLTIEAFDDAIAAMMADRPRYYESLAPAILGPHASPETVDWVLSVALQTSLLAAVECMRSQFDADFTADMSAFTMPTLIIHGGADLSQPMERGGRRTAQAIPGSRLMVYEDAPHAPFLSHRERFAADVRAFVEGAAAKRRGTRGDRSSEATQHRRADGAGRADAEDYAVPAI